MYSHSIFTLTHSVFVLCGRSSKDEARDLSAGDAVGVGGGEDALAD